MLSKKNPCFSPLCAPTLANIDKIEASELWVLFGTGKNERMLPIHEISRMIGQVKSQCLLLFHALTGTDQQK